MKHFILFVSLLYIASGQISTSTESISEALGNIFNQTLYEEVTQEPLRDYGALQKCGENERQGIDICVPYYNCDPTTKEVIQTGVRDGFNVIDIRFNTDDKQCDHFLDVCCQIPAENSSSSTPGSSTARTERTTTSTALFTSPSIATTPSSTRRTTTQSSQSSPSIPNIPDDDTGGSWSTCGIRNPNGIDFKLSGNLNNEAEYGEFPWQVALLRTNYNKRKHGHQCICGGSLIRRNVVLTAAHCVKGFAPSEITVRAGEWDTQTTKERIPYQERLAAKVLIHERYDNNGALNDIALVLLEQPYVKVKSVGAICLPKSNQFINSKNCFASGWGKSNFGKEGAYSVMLKKIELPMVSGPQCQGMLRKTRLGPDFRLHQSFVCAGGEKGKDTCTGDGGSPLVCPDPNNPRRYVQTGIVSWGVGCGEEGVPGVYTDVPKFRVWIDRKLRELGAN